MFRIIEIHSVSAIILYSSKWCDNPEERVDCRDTVKEKFRNVYFSDLSFHFWTFKELEVEGIMGVFHNTFSQQTKKIAAFFN